MSSPHGEPEARTSRSLPWVALLLVIGALAAAAWLLRSESGEAGPASAVDGAVVRDGPATVLPQHAPAELQPLQAEDLAGPVESGADAAAAIVPDYPRHAVHGRLVMADGGGLPDGITVFATASPPYPRLTRASLSEAVSRRRDFELPDVFTGNNAGLVTLTRVPVDPDDGRFVLEDVPESGAWLGVDCPVLYLDQRVELRADSDDVVVTVRRAASISGRVLDRAGRPLAGITLAAGSPVNPFMMLAEGGRTIVETDGVETDAEGRFRLAPVPPWHALRLAALPDHTWQVLRVDVPPLAPGDTHQVELRLFRAAAVSGRVVDEQGEPVSSARVELKLTVLDITDLDSMGRADGLTTATAEDGGFRFDPVPAGQYQPWLTARDWMPVSGPVLDVEQGQVVEDLELVARRGLSVAGKVVDVAGEPVQDAEVLAALPPSMMSMQANADRERHHWEEVDEQGRFELWGYEDGPVHLWARAPGWTGTELDVSAGADDVVVTLHPKVAVTGIAVRLDDAEPLTAYTVHLTRSGSAFDVANPLAAGERLRNAHRPVDVRDDDGRFVVSDVDPGTYDLSVDADGFAHTTLEGVVVDPEQGAKGLVLMVPEEARVEGQVVSARTGEPLADAVVTSGRTDLIGRLGEAFSGNAAPHARTDEQGRFRLGGLGDGEVTLTVTHFEHLSLGLDPLRLQPGEVRDLGVLALSDGASVWGTVYDRLGEPQPGVPVMVNDAAARTFRSTETDARGQYRVRGLLAGAYTVMRMDFAFDTRKDSATDMLDDMAFETVTLEAEDEQRVDLGTPEEGGTRLEGVVRSSSGPEAGALLWVLREDGEARIRFGSSDDDGSYSFDGLEPGRYLMQVLPRSETASMQSGNTGAPIAEMVQVGAGPVQRHDVQVPGTLLTGTTVDARTGDAAPGVRIVLERTDADRADSRLLAATGGRSGETYSDEHGTFRIEHVPPGTYTVVAGGQNLTGLGATGWAVTRLEGIEVSEARRLFPLRVELKPGGRIEGTLRDTAGRPLQGEPVWARNDTTGQWLGVLSETLSGPSGEYSLDGLEPGPWTVVFGGTRHAFVTVGGITVRREAATSVDAVLSDGVEVWLDPGSHPASEVVASLVGPGGPVPTGLTSVENLLGSPGRPGLIRLGRVAPGTYSVTVLAGGEVLLQASQVLVPGSPPQTIALP